MLFRVEVKDREGIFDAVGESVKKGVLDLGINCVEEVRFVQIYYLQGKLSRQEIIKISRELLIDKISQEFRIVSKPKDGFFSDSQMKVVEIAYNPGVMDPVEESALKGIRDLGIKNIQALHTSKKYALLGNISQGDFNKICEKLLYNKTIERIVNIKDMFSEHKPLEYKFKLVKVDILGADDKELEKISKNGQLFLNLTEMRAIKDYFRSLERNPTDCELETIAQTWSEHCNHKTFRGLIEYSENGRKKTINNLLKSTIAKATEELNKPWCVSVFKDNSGVIKFDKDYNVCFKVETHNHPSALEPFGGANTGIGGVIRDPMGTGLGSKPILNTDVFCFGPIDYPYSKLPKGTLHPKRVMKGVVSGVRDYGNKMGIPTVNGAVLFDESFVGNPLVYCGTVGIMPKDKSFKKTKTGDLVIVVGGKTGRDGIHGATFSSGELTHESESISGGAVQIGNPITEKKMLEAILKARDENLYSAITDCGAGGLSSAVGEMGEELGARVDLEKVPLKYKGLTYTEIWISEAQERMVLSVPKKNLKRLKEIFDLENADVTVLGEFTDTGKLELFYQRKKVCDLDMEFLHKGNPKITKKAIWIKKEHKEPKIKEAKDLGAVLNKVLSHPNICSKEWIIRQYDHEVQGGSVLKPLAGVSNDGPQDAAIARPLLNSDKGIIISCGINFRYGLIDPYWMTASCIDEALRQIISVGGSLEEVALLDNFCWGNPDKPDRLAGIVRAAQACYDFSKYFGAPFISGKDSLNNEFMVHGRSIPIAGTILISAISVMRDVKKAVSSDFKKEGNLIYCLGETSDELGGSIYYDVLGNLGANVPKVNKNYAKKIMQALSKATNSELVCSSHDCSDGGLAVALAEMAFSGGLGAEVFLGEVPVGKSEIRNPKSETNPKSKIQNPKRDDLILFSESNSRFIVEVEKDKQKEFEKLIKGLPFGLIGCVTDKEQLKIFGLDGKVVVDEDIWNLKESWQKTLRF
ncbi:MAG: phosphoribosylformylglycinamidine synthase subunit PurL [Candidatus Omnitrophica bacterium]|nr:phosphoribosylformylglycinamidine synthase subunit PurL [Candidatus Omnitrophota bacterium]MDD5352913.1 phosphoribosylformylglycinamidine synthase subunit PurL [Candidatus Omnitrophota bacterium]MDD5550512.1 phosphoribosylformylglycinamidine synthase subunit PurL [Candidatus Omnitrophota bacterium]